MIPLRHNLRNGVSAERAFLPDAVGCANGFWHSPAKIVAVVYDHGPLRTAGLTEASYKNSGRQNPLAHPMRYATPSESEQQCDRDAAMALFKAILVLRYGIELSE
jgi:hypothetical protein